MEKDDIELYKRAINKWGEPSQLLMVIEEMAELTHEITRDLRMDGTNCSIAEELADVEIMLEQLRIMRPATAKAADQIRIGKLQWLKERLDREG